MGRPSQNGAPAFRFTPNEVMEMESCLRDANNGMPAREVLVMLAEKFSASAERSGKVVVQTKQVWNWFQNRRYAQRARSAKPPAKLSISPLPRDDSVSSRHVIHPAPVAADMASEPAWQWCIRVNENDQFKLTCKFCKSQILGGISRLKHHLAGTHFNVSVCKGSKDNPLPQYVQRQCLDMLIALKEEKVDEEMSCGEPWEVDDEYEYNEDDQDLDASLGLDMASLKGKGKDVRHAGGRSYSRKGRGTPGDWCNDRVSSAESSTLEPIGSIFPSHIVPGSQRYFRTVTTSKGKIEQANIAIVRWFYDAGIPFSAVNSSHFQAMADAIASVGPGYKMPSFHQLRGEILGSVLKEEKAYCDELKLSWKETGCSIMVDEWTDTQSRTLVNFLVYCPKGTIFLKYLDLSDAPKTAESLCNIFDDIVHEVGLVNIVQFITDNTKNYKAAGELLFNRYKSFYWTPCATHCVNLTLEDLNNTYEMTLVVEQCQKITRYIYNDAYLLSLMRKFTHGVELIRPAQTRLATNVLTVQRILKQRNALRKMFSSDEWAAYPHANKRKSCAIRDIIFSNKFWESCMKLLKICIPLVKVLRLVDNKGRPSIGYLYEAMHKTKDAIRDNLKGENKLYMPIWNIIDQRWTEQLHQPLHAVAYYLNPAIRFSPTFKKDKEVMHGLLDGIEILVKEPSEQDAIIIELDLYDHCIGDMGISTAIQNRTTMRPDVWWNNFGHDCPHLRNFAIKVLSQTCSTIRCAKNWNIFEHINNKNRNRLEDKRLNDLVYVRYNMKLRQRHLENTSTTKHASQFDPISLENFDLLGSWVEEEPTTKSDEEDLEWLNIEGTKNMDEEEPVYAGKDIQFEEATNDNESKNEYDNEDDQ